MSRSEPDNQLSLEIESDPGLQSLWLEVLERAESRLGREAVESWLGDAVPVSLAAGVLTLGVGNTTARAWVEKKYGKALAGLLEEIRGEATRLMVTVQKGRSHPPSTSRAPAAPAPPARPAPSPLFASIPLNERYTFRQFVTGPSNRLAEAAAQAVAESPGRTYNPLFLYGGVGLGKTHLLHAVGHAARARDPRVRVAYISGETFTSQFITSLRERREEEFRRSYRGVDLWLVDDVQFIADKTSTKEEFFHTFNELYLTNRQIVLASDRPPRELRLMEDRLRTRLESGLLAEIAPPEPEVKVAILQRRVEQEGARVSPEVLYYLAQAAPNNVRVLEAALIRLLALASLGRCEIDGALAARALGAFVQEQRLACLSLATILQVVCAHFDLPENEVVGPRRHRHISQARQVAMYLMRELSRKSLAEIGEVFGGKAHSTVLYACGKLEREMAADPTLESAVRSLRARLTGPG